MAQRKTGLSNIERALADCDCDAQRKVNQPRFARSGLNGRLAIRLAGFKIMQNIGSTFKHFSFFAFIYQYLSAWYICAYAIFGLFISFSAIAETTPFIPREMMLNNIGIKFFSIVEPRFDLRLHFEVDRTNNFIELYAPVPLDGEMVSDESASKETGYSEKLGIFLKNFVDFFKHHFYFIES